MKKILVIVCYLTSLFLIPAYAEIGVRHVEATGGFSFQAPKGWQFREFPGMKYQVVLGPVKDKFGSNMVVVDEAFEGSLNSYVDANINAISNMFAQFQLIKREPFVTSKGLKAERVVTTALQQNAPLRQIYYFIPGKKGRYFVVTCSTLAANGAEYDATFNESVKTFEVTKRI